MSPRVSPLVRDFHLYVGLFLSPFVLLFAISVVFLVHAWLPGAAAKPATRAATEISLPADFEKLKGREQLAVTHGVLDRTSRSWCQPTVANRLARCACGVHRGTT